MKHLDAEFSARLTSGVTTTCLCWRLERRDGYVLAVTEHDRALVVDGVTYLPGAAFTAGSFSQSAAMMPAQASASGALSHDGLSEGDLAAGLWDGARVDVMRADWRRPEGHVDLWTGRISEVQRGAAGFEAALVSLKADLERPVGRVFSRSCDAVLGDERCMAVAGGRTCDQRFATCRDVFANAANFRGFPHSPAADFLLQGPAAAGNDGGRR